MQTHDIPTPRFSKAWTAQREHGAQKPDGLEALYSVGSLVIKPVHHAVMDGRGDAITAR